MDQLKEHKLKMKMLLVCASLGILIFVIAFALGGAFVIATGIPLIGGIVQVILLAMVFAIGSKMFEKFGAFTIISLAFTLVSSPTIVFGPPGFYKIFLGLVLGIIVDIIVFLFRYKNIGRHIGIAIGFVLCVPMIWYSLSLIGLSEEAKRLHDLMVVIMIVYAIEGFVGSIIGVNIFKKRLEKLNFIRNLTDARDK